MYAPFYMPAAIKPPRKNLPKPSNTTVNTSKPAGLRKGWWKPLVTGAISGIVGGASGFVASGGNPVAAVTGAVTGAKKGFDVHEDVRKKFNVPWLGKKKKKKRVGKKRK